MTLLESDPFVAGSLGSTCASYQTSRGITGGFAGDNYNGYTFRWNNLLAASYGCVDRERDATVTCEFNTFYAWSR